MQQHSQKEINSILRGYWKRYTELKHGVQPQPTSGGSLMVHLAAMSVAFYRDLVARGYDEKVATRLFYDIAWQVYAKVGRFSWWLAGWGSRTNYGRLLRATELFRAFPFNSPSYTWQEVEPTENVVGFNCLKCPVAEYFQLHGLSTFCAKTWCELDYPLAELWHARLERNGSIAGGATKCDFRWIANANKTTRGLLTRSEKH